MTLHRLWKWKVDTVHRAGVASGSFPYLREKLVPVIPWWLGPQCMRRTDFSLRVFRQRAPNVRPDVPTASF